MWIRDQDYSKINSALRGGASSDLEGALFPILRGASEKAAVPDHCPSCGNELRRQALPYIELFVSACPSGHGVWLSPGVSKKLRQLVQESAAAAVPKSKRVQILNRIAVASLLLLFGYALWTLGPVSVNHNGHSKLDGIKAASISETNWPERAAGRFTALPLKESVIDRQEELFYFMNLTALLEEGISNRLNMDDVLQTRRPAEEYAILYQIFEERQTGFLKQLEALEPPARLLPFHAHLLAAVQSQIIFYGNFAQSRSSNPSVKFQDFLNQPELRKCNAELLAAYSEFSKLYPVRDSRTESAIYQRLCWLDII